MDADHTLTAVFTEIPLVYYNLTVSVDGSGGTDPSAGTHTYEEGAEVDVSATASSGWVFDHWEMDSVDVGSANPYTITMDADHTLTAVFTEIPVVDYDLTIVVDGSGSTSPSEGTHTYEEGTEVDVNAFASSGWVFDHWELDSIDVGSNTPYTVTMDANHTLTAVFTEIPPILYNLSISVSGSGSTSPSVGTHTYEEGTEVDVTATASSGWNFDHWELDSVDVGSANPYIVTMDADHTLIAVFTEIPVVDYDLTVVVDGSGSASPSAGTHSYEEGTEVDVNAIASSGWVFDHWELDSVNVGSTTPYTVQMGADHMLTAVFTEVPDETPLEPPVASFTFSPSSPKVGDAVTFDASTSSDLDGSIVSYDWEFGDGSTGIGVNPDYSYSSTGTYTVTLTVTDDDGLTDTKTESVTVSESDEPEPDVTSPVAVAGNDVNVKVGSTVTFVASASSDDVGIVSYEWHFGDGTTGSGETLTHIYTAKGAYIVSLIVTDAAGNSDTDILIVTVETEESPTALWILIPLIAAVAGSTLVILNFEMAKSKKKTQNQQDQQ